MDRPGTSHSVEKVEMYEVREHVPYQAELTRAPTTCDDESGSGYDSSWVAAWNAICQLINMAYHMQIAIIVFYLWYFALTVAPNGAVTNLEMHIVVAGTGYQLFLVEAILTLHKHNSWTFQLSPDSKRIVHGCLQLIGSLFVIAGTFLALTHTDMAVGTAHGICGVIAFAFTLLSLISGIVTLFSPKVRLMVKNGPVKIFHISVGLLSITGGLVTITLGFHMDYFRAHQPGLSTALMTFALLILLYVLVQPIVDLIEAIKRIL